MQKLHFFESEFSFFMSFSMAIFIMTILIGLNFDVYPVIDFNSSYLLLATVTAASYEAFSVARSRGLSYQDQLIARRTWLGLMPVFISSAIKALYYGPNKKPKYKVTKKFHTIGWYWRETIIQLLIVISLSVTVILSLIRLDEFNLEKTCMMFWAIYFIYGFLQVIKNSWHNYSFLKFKTN